MIVRARVVLTMDGPALEDGGVAVVGNRIADVGGFDEVAKRNSGDVLDLGEIILLPGLINAHCHLDYTALRGSVPAQNSFTDWIRAINQRKAAMAAEDFLASIEEGFEQAALFGTTTIVNLEAFPELISSVRRPALRTWWCAELIDVREKIDAREMYGHLEKMLPPVGESRERIGLAPHALYTASPRLYAEVNAIARSRDLLLTTHVAESREETLMFQNASGPLMEFLTEIGRPMEDCGGQSPLARLLTTQEVDERWLIAHLNELSVEDIELLARAKRFQIVHCPRSNRFFNHAPFELKRLRSLGFNICLGTDSLASNSDLSLFAEMREAMDVHRLAPIEALATTTINGARALRQENTLGRIHAGFYADMIGIPFTGATIGAPDAVVASEGGVPWAMVEGQVLRAV